MITPPPTQTQRVPDLQMSVGEGQFGSVAPGSTFEVAVVVENAGSVQTAPTNIRWLRSDSSTIAATDTRQGSTPVNRLNGGQYVSETFTFTAPTENGVYYYGACVDGVTGETNTRNNCDSSVIRINVGTLQISVGEGRLDDVASGSTFTVSAVVQYIGSGQSSAARLKWYRSSDAVIQSTDTEMGDEPIPALHRGSSHRESFQFTAPSASGTYYFGACIDQASRANVRASGCASETVRVTVTPTSDLTVAVGEDQFDNIQPRSTFRISAVVQNIGAGQSSPTTLRWLRSDTDTIRRTDNVLSTSSVRSLDRGGYQRISQTITVPGAEGTYYFGACVDPPDNETDSTNNCSTDFVRIVVRNRPADTPNLTIRIGAGRLSNVRSLSSITLNAVVQNVGTGSSRPTSIDWYRSSDSRITSDDEPEGSSSIGALSSGEYEEITKNIEVPFLDGTYYYGACIDLDRGQCTESVRVTVE